MNNNKNKMLTDFIISKYETESAINDNKFLYEVNALQSKAGTKFSFGILNLSLLDNLYVECTPVSIISDEICYKSSGNQIQITVSDCKMANVFSEILDRKVFSLPVFQTDAELYSPYIEPLTSVLQYHVRNANSRNHPPLLIGTIIDNIVKHIAYVWPNTHSAEIYIDPIHQPPLALRLALDYIYSKKGVVNGADDVAYNSNIGLRSLEILFNEKIGTGIKKYCKAIKIRNIIKDLEEEISINEIAANYKVSNITRLRKEIEDYNSNSIRVFYPHEYYNSF